MKIVYTDSAMLLNGYQNNRPSIEAVFKGGQSTAGLGDSGREKCTPLHIAVNSGVNTRVLGCVVRETRARGLPRRVPPLRSTKRIDFVGDRYILPQLPVGHRDTEIFETYKTRRVQLLPTR